MPFELHVKQLINTPPTRAWNFLCDVDNLAVLTPKFLHFKTQYKSHEKVKQGVVFVHKIKPFSLIGLTWTSYITEFERGRSFSDIQLEGPYKTWVHQHSIEEYKEDVCFMIDKVLFSLKFGPLNPLIYALVVKPSILKAFEFRRQKIEALFNSASDFQKNYTLQLKKIK
jgi:ligand-binding SRPBCC domain-containing protein